MVNYQLNQRNVLGHKESPKRVKRIKKTEIKTD